MSPGSNSQLLSMKINTKLSVIIPVCHRFDNITELYIEYKHNIEIYTHQYEIIFVLDGQTPSAYKQLDSLIQQGEKFRIIKLSRNFGEAAALTAGFEHSNGNIILTLPAYYQVDPSEIPKILEEKKNWDMIISRRNPRTGSKFEKMRRHIFHWFLYYVTGYKFHDLGSNMRVFDRKVMSEIPVYADQFRFLPILAARMGFKVLELNLKQSPKDYYHHGYRLREYLHRLLDILTVFFLVRFTKKPLRFFGMIGSLTFIAGGLITLYLVFERLFLDVGLAERPALLLSSLLVVLGIQIIAIGLIGELIIFTHAKELKEYTIERIIN